MSLLFSKETLVAIETSYCYPDPSILRPADADAAAYGLASIPLCMPNAWQLAYDTY